MNANIFLEIKKKEKFRRERGAGNHVRLQNRLKMKLKNMIKACHTKQ